MKDQTSKGSLSTPLNTLLFHLPSHKIANSHTIKIAFSPKGRLRRNSSIISLTFLCQMIITPNIWKKESQTRFRYNTKEYGIMVQVFLHLLAKNTTRRRNQRAHLLHKPIQSVNTAKENLPSKELYLPRDLSPPNSRKDQNL